MPLRLTWPEVYELSPLLGRGALEVILDELDIAPPAFTKQAFASLGFAVRPQGRRAMAERIRRRFLDRHDTSARVRIGLGT